jgi:hypothetical protein
MHTIEPYFNWRPLYIASEDDRSPFYGRDYSEFEFTNKVYNYLIHPQWDEFGSETLYLKILYVDYTAGYGIIEFIGEWNDLLYNDIMFLKREVVEVMLGQGINKFILIGENVLNFHASDNDYYQEWFDEIEDGWIVCLNFRKHVVEEFMRSHIDYYLAFGGQFDEIPWRAMTPGRLYQIVSQLIMRRLNP